jgi:hypothetical protein
MTKAEKAEYDRLYRARNRQRILSGKRAYYHANREKCLKQAAQWQRDNPHKCLVRTRKWRAKNLEKKRAIDRAYQNRRWKEDPNYRLSHALRNRINAALTGRAKSKRTSQLIGCSIDSLWIYLESRFEEGVTRENYGRVWEVDHILPCALFDLSRPDHQARCFHFSNLQPLLSEDNRRKSTRTNAARFERLWE